MAEIRLRDHQAGGTPQVDLVAKRRWTRFSFTMAMVILILALLTSLATALVAGRGFLWLVEAQEPVKLVVCWQNPNDAEPLSTEADKTPGWQRREWVRLALKRSWERHARVIFVGWETCQDEGNPVPPPHTFGPRRPGTGDENLKILITTSGGGQNPGHGSWGDHQVDGIRLNLHSTCGGSLRTCIDFLSMHEFGHALGFYHGEERSDWPSIPGCPKQTYAPTYPWWPIPTELRYGDPDPASIMSYCAGYITELSPGDVTAVQRIYERHLPGTLLNQTASLCLSSHANQPNGAGVFGWACDEAYDDQEWQYDRTKQALYIQWPSDPTQARRCLDVNTLNYTTVQTWDCHYGSNQQWRFRRVLLRGYGGLCLTRPTSGLSPVTMQTCDDDSRQLWRLEPGQIQGSLRFQAENELLCLTATGDSGARARVEPCYLGNPVFLPLQVQSGAVTRLSPGETAPELTSTVLGVGQSFTLRPGGQIQLPYTRMGGATHCLDVRDVRNDDYIDGKGGPEPGQVVQVFSCLSDQLNQRWNLSGDVFSGGKCLDLDGDASTNGRNAVMRRCDTSISQEWDYYW